MDIPLQHEEPALLGYFTNPCVVLLVPFPIFQGRARRDDVDASGVSLEGFFEFQPLLRAQHAGVAFLLSEAP